MSQPQKYGSTPITWDEVDALLPQVRAAFESTPTKSEIYDLETSIAEDVADKYFTEVLNGQLPVENLFQISFLKQLHKDLYDNIWIWAGTFRTTARSIGWNIDSSQVHGELLSSFDMLKYHALDRKDWCAKTLGIATHADLVRIHPFPDGNGRSTRLLGDLISLYFQEDDELFVFDWETVDMRRGEYIRLLREYDEHRDPRALVEFVPVASLRG